MINREIPFRPRLEGEFRIRFYNAASEITEKTPTLTIAKIAEREIELKRIANIILNSAKNIVPFGFCFEI